MKKNIFKKMYSPELTEQLAKYAPADDKILAKSEKKLQDSKLSDDVQYEYEVRGVEHYRKRRLAPVISFAVCGALAAGIGGIYALQTNKPNLTPGSSMQLEALQKLPPFGDIAGLELKFGKGLLPIQLDMEDIPPERLFTISPEQQVELSDALCAINWEEPVNNNIPSKDSCPFSMYFHKSDGYNIIRFYLDYNMIEWIYPSTDLNGMLSYEGLYYQIDETLSSNIRNIVLNDDLTTYVPEYVMDDFVEIEDRRYIHHSLSSAYAFNMSDLNKADILFTTEDTVPEYYTITPEQKRQLAEYIADTEAWYEASSSAEYDNPENGERICMFFSCDGNTSIVTFWSNGYITELGDCGDLFCWWKTRPEMFDYLKTLTAAKQDSFTLTLPYSSLDEIMQNPDDVLDEVFDKQDAPTSGIAYDRLRVMMDSPYALDVPEDKQQELADAMIGSPYALDIPEDKQQEQADAMDNAVWREIDKNTPEPDGMRISLYVRNSGEPYVLHFYDNNFVMWDNGTQQRKFRTLENLALLVHGAVNDPKLYEDDEHLIYIKQSDNMIKTVWDDVEEVDIPTYNPDTLNQ